MRPGRLHEFWPFIHRHRHPQSRCFIRRPFRLRRVPLHNFVQRAVVLVSFSNVNGNIGLPCRKKVHTLQSRHVVNAGHCLLDNGTQLCGQLNHGHSLHPQHDFSGGKPLFCILNAFLNGGQAFLKIAGAGLLFWFLRVRIIPLALLMHRHAILDAIWTGVGDCIRGNLGGVACDNGAVYQVASR